MDDDTKARVGQAIQKLLSRDMRMGVDGANELSTLIQSDLWTLQLVAEDTRVIPQLVCLFKQPDEKAQSAARGLLRRISRGKDVGPFEIALAFDEAAIQIVYRTEHKRLFCDLFQQYSHRVGVAPLNAPDFTAAVKRANDTAIDATNKNISQAIHFLMSTDSKEQAQGVKHIKDIGERAYLWATAAFAEKDQVISRLVCVLREGSEAEKSDSHLALHYIAETGEAAKRKIAIQLISAPIAALEIRQNPFLLTSLMKNQQAAATVTSKFLFDLVPVLQKGLRGPSNEMMEVLVATLRVLSSTPHAVKNLKPDTTCAIVLCALTDALHVLKARAALLQTHLSTAEQVRVLKTSGYDRLGLAKKRYAAVCMANAIQTDEAVRRTVIQQGGIGLLLAHLNDELERKHASLDERSASDEVQRFAVLALRDASEAEPAVLKQLMSTSSAAVTAFFVLAYSNQNSGSQYESSFSLKQIMNDVKYTQIVASRGGMAFLVHLLRRAEREASKLRVLAELERILLGTTGILNHGGRSSAISRLIESGGMSILTELCCDATKPSLQMKATTLLQGLSTVLIPELLSCLPDRDSLQALEIISRNFENQDIGDWIVNLSTVMNGSDPALKCIAARALANLACNQAENRVLITQSGLTGSLVAMLMSSESTSRVAAAMAIRNLAGGRKNRDSVVWVGALPALVSMLRGGGSVQERVVAAGALGNLARGSHAAYRYFMVQYGAIDSLVEPLASKTAPMKLKAITATALAVLVKDCGKYQSRLASVGGY